MTKKTTLKLTDEQREKAYHIIQTLHSNPDKITHPTDLINEWVPQPSHDKITWTGNTEEQYVNTDNIIGTEAMNTDRLEPSRLMKTLARLVNNQYHEQPRSPPSLNKIEDEYYVGADGNHRCIIFKALGIEQIYAEVNEYRRRDPS